MHGEGKEKNEDGTVMVTAVWHNGFLKEGTHDTFTWKNGT